MIWKSLVVLLLALTTHLSESSISSMDNTKQQNVVGASVFRKGQMVKQGSLVRLTCHTERPWFFCLWQSPGEDRQCAINFQETKPETVCKGKRLALQGSENSCNLEIKAEASDHGAWMCLVTYDDDFETNKVFIDLEVAVKANLVIQFDEENEEQQSIIQQRLLHKKAMTRSVSTDVIEEENVLHIDEEGDYREEDKVLHIDEGEVKSVTCSARRAYPRSQLSWTLNNSTLSDLDDLSQAMIKFYKDDHWMDTTQSVKLIGDLEKHNSTLACWSRQINRTGQVIFVQSTSVRISVHEVAAPLILTKTSESIGLLILIILLFLIVTFLCIILAIPSRRRRNRKQKERRQTMQNGIHVPTESSRRRGSYDQNRNKLRIKRNPFRDSILKAEELLDQAFEDKSEDPVGIVGDPKVSLVTFSERGIDLPNSSYALAGSQKAASNSPSRAESQISLSNSFSRTESKKSFSYPPSREESQRSPTKSSSRASLSVSPSNPVMLRILDKDGVFDTSTPIDHVSFGDLADTINHVSYDDPADSIGHISFEDSAASYENVNFKDAPHENINLKDAPHENINLKYSPYENINHKNDPHEQLNLKDAPHEHTNLKDPPHDNINLKDVPHEMINVKDGPFASDPGFLDDVSNPRYVLPASSLAPKKPSNAKDSVFYCNEGCFNLSSPCTHIRVAIPRSTKV